MDEYYLSEAELVERSIIRRMREVGGAQAAYGPRWDASDDGVVGKEKSWPGFSLRRSVPGGVGGNIKSRFFDDAIFIGRIELFPLLKSFTILSSLQMIMNTDMMILFLTFVNRLTVI